MRHSNTKTEFETGAKRDTNEGKGQPSLISPVLIHRLGVLLQKGAKHYGADNWTKGMPYRRTMDSVIRHAFQWLAGDEEEDHLAAIAFGVMCLMTYEEQVRGVKVPTPGKNLMLDDRCKKLKEIIPSILTSPEKDPKIVMMTEKEMVDHKKRISEPHRAAIGLRPTSSPVVSEEELRESNRKLEEEAHRVYMEARYGTR